MEILQLVDPNTLLLVYRENYVHLQGRDGNPGDHGVRIAKDIVDKLVFNRSKRFEQTVYLAGLWFDCKSNGAELNLVTDMIPNLETLASVLTHSVEALEVMKAHCLEVHGSIAEHLINSDSDYAHHVDKFYGRKAELRGIARLESSNDYGIIGFGDNIIPWSSHPFEVRVIPDYRLSLRSCFEQLIVQGEIDFIIGELLSHSRL